MLWLIWIAMMLLVPIAAGVQVWLQLRREPADVPANTELCGTVSHCSAEDVITA
jgi:hypothetical protein